MNKKHLVLGLSHVGIKTTDPEKSMDFYKNLLGFQHYYHHELTGGTTLDFLRAGSCAIELIYSPGFKDEDMGREGTVSHLALEVLDIEELVASLKKTGVDTWLSESIGELPELFPTGSRNIFFKGPSGELLELFEHATKKA